MKNQKKIFFILFFSATALLISRHRTSEFQWTIPGVYFPNDYKFEKDILKGGEQVYNYFEYQLKFFAPTGARQWTIAENVDKRWILSSQGNHFTNYELKILNDLNNLSSGLVVNKTLTYVHWEDTFLYTEYTISPSWKPNNISNKEFIEAYSECLRIVQNPSYSSTQKKEMIMVKQDSLGAAAFTEIVRNVPIFDPNTQKITTLDNFARKYANNYLSSYDIPLKNDPIGYTIKIINMPTIKNISEALNLKIY